MIKKFLSTAMVIAAVCFTVVGLGWNAYALRPSSTAGDSDKVDEISAKMWDYGFATGAGVTLAHDRVFRAEAARAFSEGRAIPLFGHLAVADLNQAAQEFLQKNGEVDITKQEVVNRLRKSKEFLGRVFNPKFIERVINELSAIDEAKVEKKALPFLGRIKEIAAIEDADLRQKEARKFLVEDTRFVVFIFGQQGLDPYLFNVGNILSKEHRALVAHIGTFAYDGSENVAGGARTIYTALGRINGFADNRGHVEASEEYQEMMLHEFRDMAYGRHLESSAKVVAKVNAVNAAIDKEYHNVVRSVVTNITEEGPVVVSNDKVSIEKYRLVNDLGKKDTFAIKGSSKVHPAIPKGKALVTVTIAKADVGSIGGHGTAPGHMLEAVAETWMKAAEEGRVLDFFITRVGDDISVTVTHAKGKDDRSVHQLVWDGFVHAAVIAKDLGYYGAGQDLLADAFSGNIRGAGPSIAEMVIKEQGSEVLIIGQADKTAPGAFNQGLYRVLFSPNTTWRPLGKGQARNMKVGVLDFDHNDHAGRHIWFGKEDYDDAAWFLGYPDRYTIDNVTLGDGQDFAAVTAQRLGIIAGEYVGKDDPMFMIRSQSAFPAVGEITSAFLTGEYFVPGWMRGSNKGPFFPVALTDAKIGIYDGPPLLSMWSFNVNNGRLEGFYDLLAANPAIRYIQDRRAAAAVRQLEEGFHEMGLRLGPEEIEYQAGPKKIEEALKGRWEEYASKKTAEVAEQKQADTAWDAVARQIAAGKTAAALKAMFEARWGAVLAPLAQSLASDINHGLSAAVLELNSNPNSKAYPILVSYDSLVRTSPDGIMAMENILEQIGQEGNIKIVLHVARDGVSSQEVDKILDDAFAQINKINEGRTNISRDMFAAVVVGTDAEQVAAQVREQVKADIYQVIGPEAYVEQFRGAIRIVLNPAQKGQMTLISKALKLGLEAIMNEGKLSDEDVKNLDALFSSDGNGTFHVGSSDVAKNVSDIAEAYARQVEAEVRV